MNAGIVGITVTNPHVELRQGTGSQTETGRISSFESRHRSHSVGIGIHVPVRKRRSRLAICPPTACKFRQTKAFFTDYEAVQEPVRSSQPEKPSFALNAEPIPDFGDPARTVRAGPHTDFLAVST